MNYYKPLFTANPRSSSACSQNTQISPTFLLSQQKFFHKSPVRSYIKSNEISLRKEMRKSLLQKIQDLPKQHKKPRKNILISRRLSTCTDKYQILWETLKERIKNENYDLEQLYDFFFELLKQQDHIQIEKYNFNIQSKQEFSKFKHYFINLFLQESILYKVIYKIEILRQSTSLYIELGGYSEITKLIDQLYNESINDLVIQPFVQLVNKQQFIEYVHIFLTNLIQYNYSQMISVQEFSNKYQLNHVHFTQFKYKIYKILIQQGISQRAIKKILKLIDIYKSSILRTKSLRSLIEEQSDIINNQFNDQQKYQINFLMEYITKNDQRIIKKDDIILLNIDPGCVPILITNISKLNIHPLLKQDFIQDIKSCFSQNYIIPDKLMQKFAKKLQYLSFFASIYKENIVNPNILIPIELDFMIKNRTYFRKKEIQMIHQRFQITNDHFDMYLQKIQETFGIFSTILITRINHYRNWVVNI